MTETVPLLSPKSDYQMCLCNHVVNGNRVVVCACIDYNIIKIKGFLYAFYLECWLKKWRFCEVNVYEIEDTVELRTRNDRMMCALNTTTRPASIVLTNHVLQCTAATG